MFEPRDAQCPVSDVDAVDNLISGAWFKRVTRQIRDFYGDDNIFALPIILSYDATSLTKEAMGSRRSATPLYITIAGGFLTAEDGTIDARLSRCIGFFPSFKGPRADLVKSLRKQDAAMSKTALSKCIAYAESYIEQQYLQKVLKQINDLTVNGGFAAMTLSAAQLKAIQERGATHKFAVHNGSHYDHAVFVPVVCCIVMDTQGAHSSLGLFNARSCNCPCRICVRPHGSIQWPCGEYEFRDPKLHDDLVTNCEDIFLRTRGNTAKQNRIERRQFMKLQALSCHPIQCAVQKTFSNHPFLKQNSFMMYPPDVMHTLLEGVMKDMIFWTASIIECVATLDKPKYGSNMSLLDAKLIKFPLNGIPHIMRKKFRFNKVD